HIYLTPFYTRQVKSAEPVLDQISDLGRIRQPVLNHIVEAPKQGLVQHAGKVRGRNDDALGIVPFQEQEKRVQYSAHFADVVARRPRGADGIELVEEVCPFRLVHRIEEQMQLGGCLAHVFRDEAVQLNGQ